jgi:hypothetical protein
VLRAPCVAQTNARSFCDAATRRLQAVMKLSALIFPTSSITRRRSGARRPNRCWAPSTHTHPFIAMNLWDLLQWPAMVATLASTWLVGSRRKTLRMVGFYTFLVSNVLWIAWGWHDGAWALVALQVGLAILNVRGAAKNETGA